MWSQYICSLFCLMDIRGAMNGAKHDVFASYMGSDRWRWWNKRNTKCTESARVIQLYSQLGKINMPSMKNNSPLTKTRALFFLNMTSTISVRSQVRSWVGVKKMVRISSQWTCPSLSWRFSRRFKGCKVWLRDFWLEHFLKMSMYSLFLGWVFHRRTGYIL